jgi:hypothetical protein
MPTLEFVAVADFVDSLHTIAHPWQLNLLCTSQMRNNNTEYSTIQHGQTSCEYTMIKLRREGPRKRLT